VICFFCPNQLNSSDEHVVLSGLGGRKSSKLIMCSKCNNRFGSTIDAALLEALNPFTHIVNPIRRRKALAERKRVVDDKGIEYEMLPGGKLKFRYKQTGENQWIADAADAERVLANTQRAAEAKEQRSGLTSQVTSSTGCEIPGPITFNVRIDNVTAVRALMKWALDLLAMHVLASDESRERVLADERQFVFDASTAPWCGYLERSLVPQMFQGLEHYVLIAQTPDGSICWEASAYGGAIAAAGRTAPIPTRFDPIMYRVDPMTGKHATEYPDINVRDGHCWWVPQFDATCHQRMTEAARKLSILMNSKIGIDELVAECLEAHLPNDVIITQEHTNAIARCVAEKYVALMKQLGAVDSPN
jgi:hypothetical protein